VTRTLWRQAVGGIVLAVLAQCVAAQAAANSPLVRVLLESSQDTITLEGAGGATYRVARHGKTGLRVNGLPVGDHWETPRPGVQQVLGWRARGRVRFVRRAEEILVVAHVPLEAYVEGTVGREMPTSWSADALRAQAVVSRTYALYAVRRPTDPDYDLEATVMSQLFGGDAAVVPSVRSAVAATRGEYLAHHGAPILAVFHSASGGRTAGSEEVWGRSLPYLQSQVVRDEDEAPSTYWRASLSRPTLRRLLVERGVDVGAQPEVEVLSRWPSGRVKQVRVRGSEGTVEFAGQLLRDAVGLNILKSTLFEVRGDPAEIVFVGSGHGHGVGMSQWGARSMARRGADHREILATFYPGATMAILPNASIAAKFAEGGRER